jgi:streptogramin lyase
VWVGAHPGLVPIDPADDHTLRPVVHRSSNNVIGVSGWSVSFGASNVWSLADDGELIRVDPATFRGTGSVRVSAAGTGLAVGFDGVWVIDKLSGTLTRVDPKTLEPDQPIKIAGELDAVAVGADGVWILDSSGGVVVRVDPNTGVVGSPIRVGGDPTDIAVGLGAVWVTNRGDETISRIDPVTRIAAPIPVGAPVTSIAVDETTGMLWVAVQPPLVTP